MSPTVPPSSWRHALRPIAGIILFILVVGTVATARPQTGPDAVERLRLSLRTPEADPGERDTSLKDCLGGLRGLSEVRRALLLSEWHASRVFDAERQVVMLNHNLLVERFLHEWRDALRRGDTATTGLVLNVVAEMAVELRNQGDGTAMIRPLAPDLAALTRRGDSRLRAMAARVLSQLEADVTVVVPALADLAHDPEPTLKRAGMDGLAEVLNTAGATLARPENAGRSTHARAELMRVILAVLPVVGRALDDPRLEIRRAAATTIGVAASLAGRLFSDPPSADQLRTDEGRQLWQVVRAERAEVRPLLAALREPGAALVEALTRADAQDRLAAQKALEEMANVRRRWLQQTAEAGPADDLLLDLFRAALPALAGATADPFVRVRCSAIDVLETIGPAAAPAAPALAAALEDEDHLVRWSAARALREIGPAAASCATPGLARLLEDADPDVRLAAAAALQQFASSHEVAGGRPPAHAPARLSPVARTALPTLLRSLRSDEWEVRSAALWTLRQLGPEARLAVPALRRALADVEPPLRALAAETLGQLGPLAREAVVDLRRATTDESPDVRRAAAAALLNILGERDR